MNLMGVGPMELFVVLLVAFLVLGPERMVTSARDAARLVADLRQTLSNIPRTLDDLLDAPDDADADGTRDESPGVARPRRQRPADGDPKAEE